MRVLVPVKRVVDYNVLVRPKPDGSEVDLADLRMSMNPFDEIALEEAVRLREGGLATEVVAVSCGPEACADTLRTAIALGADRAVLVCTEFALQPIDVAKLLRAVAQSERVQLVIAGKQAIDDDASQTGQMLAAMLGWPQATFASKVQVGDGRVRVVREIDGGTETVEVSLPAVITADLRLNQPRYAALPNLMKARKRDIPIMTPEALGVELVPRLRVLQVMTPPSRKAGKLLNSPAELIAALRNEPGLLPSE